MSDIILETRGLTKHYGGVQALDDANFILHAGEHVAVVGDNGAGKSTFVRQITAVEQRTAGQIFFYLKWKMIYRLPTMCFMRVGIHAQ